MPFDSIQQTERGLCVRGTTQSGRKAELILIEDGRGTRFDAVVHPMDGHEQMGDRAIDIELARVIAEQDSIIERLSPFTGDGTDPRESLRAAASLLDRREVEPELIEALLGLAPTPSAM